MTVEISRQMLYGLNLVKHALDFGPIAAKRKDRAIYQVEQTGIGEYIVNGGRYMDIGTGKGYVRNVIEGLKPGVQVFGCDVDDWPTRKMRRSTSPTFAFADGSLLPYKDESFDGTMMFFVFHHMPYEKQQEVLLEAKRITKENGYIFVAEDTVSRNDAKQWRLTTSADHMFNPDLGEKRPHNFRSTEEWENLFCQNELKVVNEVSYNTGKVAHTFFVLQ